MSDKEENLDEVENDSDDEGGGMRAAYSIDDLMGEVENEGEENSEDGEEENIDINGEENLKKNETNMTEGKSKVCQNESKIFSEQSNENNNAERKDSPTQNHSVTNKSEENLESVVNEFNESGNPNLASLVTITDPELGSSGFGDTEEIYPTSKKIQENKRLLLVSESDSVNSPRKTLGNSADDNNTDYENIGENKSGPNSPMDHNYEAVYDDVAEDDEGQKGGTLVPGQHPCNHDGPHDIYENVDCSQQSHAKASGADVVDEWDSSEFEDYDSGDQSQQSQESLSQSNASGSFGSVKEAKSSRLPWKRSHSSNPPELLSPSSNQASSMLEKVAARFGQKLWREDSSEPSEDSCVLEVVVNPSKHPPPQLPPAPEGLSSLQLKRRQVVSTIIESEKSYSASLLRLVEDYEKPLLEAKPTVLARNAIRIIFCKIREILGCHNMFRIELSDMANNWDTEEKIGDVFTASFSKSIVFDVYKEFVVNFSAAMETAKKQARKQTAFAEFLKQKLEASQDRLSLFGLMVKPVQRFPQFIMLLQDLLKFTPKEHHDRLSLQLALTELETLTDRLNEAKHESESRLEVRRLLDNLNGIIAFKVGDNCFLIRQDDVIEIKQKNGEPQERQRRLFLLNDQLICTDVQKRDPTSSEKFNFQWSIPIGDVEIVESTLPSSYTVHGRSGKTLVSAKKSEQAPVPSDSNPYRKELDDMMHDLNLFQSMLQLAETLRLKYSPNFDPEALRIVMRSLQMRIAQKHSIEHCLLTLSLPAKVLLVSNQRQIKDQVTKHIGKVGRAKSVTDDVRSNSRVQFTFQFGTVALKNDWLQEVQNTKVTTGPLNHPTWYTSENSQPSFRSPHFLHPLLLDITKEDSKKLLKSKKKTKDTVHCATCVTLPSADDIGLGVQHLWVCNGDQSRGQVSIVSLNANQPYIVESFKVCDCPISCVESVPAAGTSGDSVWIGTEEKKIIICKVAENDRSTKRQTINTDSSVTCLKYLNAKVFAGTKNGLVLVYCCIDGDWNFKKPLKQSLGGAKVSCLLPVNQEMWVSSGLSIHKLTVVTSSKANPISKESHELSSDYGMIECMVKAGVGLLVAFSNRAVIRLYHLETLQHLQDINVASAITPLLEGKQLVTPFSEDKKLFSLNITCLLSGNGLLWIGTNYGFILTLPLPRLEGVPQMKQRPVISFHAHSGPVKFLTSVHCGSMKLPGSLSKQMTSTGSKMLESIESKNVASNDELVPIRQRDKDQSDEEEPAEIKAEEDAGIHSRITHSLSSGQWSSNPELGSIDDSDEDSDDVGCLYDCLLKGVDAEMDSQLVHSLLRRSRMKGASFHHNLNAVSDRVNKISKSVRRNLTSSAQNRFTTGRCQSAISYVPDNRASPVDGETIDSEAVASEGSASETTLQGSTPGVCGDQNLESAVELQTNQGSSAHQTDTKAAPSGSAAAAAAALPSPSASRRNVHSKRLVLVSGGDGHVNWKEKKPFDKSCEDICLLLWKC